ncbi:endoplasmic reticulum resident protein 44-like [Dysidea avara]|uniref:endoplasmic reticulum resident protein 44-like n=1 Tax=Dysidea avara TaxID=196820 RepID=UPI00331F6FAA
MYHTLLLVAISWRLLAPGSGEAISIDEQNYETYRSTTPILFLNFYADWCRYSQALKPIFDKTADTLLNEYPGQVVLGRINCESSRVLCQSIFHINKYPTLKLLRNGQSAKKEYRGQRSISALSDYVKRQLADPVQAYTGEQKFGKLEVTKAVVGHFRSEDSATALVFKKVAISLRDDCPFYIKLETDRIDDRVVYADDEGYPNDYPGNKEDFAEFYNWARTQCVPIVREITFENGEELTEEGLPFVVLFHHPEDHNSVRMYKEKVEAELMPETSSVNFVYADGVKFAHPLSHLGKTKRDLPLIAIDSFRHMYMFPGTFEDIHVPGKMKQFIADLHSGKLHREFHHGPDPTQAPEVTQPQDGGDDDASKQTAPPESTFRKLRPAKSRYSLLRDEL